VDYDGRRLIGVRYWLAANSRLAQAESLYPGVQAEASPHPLIITPNRAHSPANNGTSECVTTREGGRTVPLG
jgi:hypothetical protein